MDSDKVFLRARGYQHHQNLGLGAIGQTAAAEPATRSTGLAHFASEANTIEVIAEAKDALSTVDAYLRAADHSHSKSIYGHDPDGNGFEITWTLLREQWKSAAE